MPKRRSIKAVLHNFLETYTSRYSDHDGYWLFGQIVEGLDRAEIDLLGADMTGRKDLTATAAELAAAKFACQLKASGLGLSCIREAKLTVAKLPGTCKGIVNTHIRPGYRISFMVRVVSDFGRAYVCEKEIFVAPHDAMIEQRSASG